MCVCVCVCVCVCACARACVHSASAHGVCVNGLNLDIIWVCQLPLIIPTHCQIAEDYNLISTRHESLETAKVRLYKYAYLLLWLIVISAVGSMIVV